MTYLTDATGADPGSTGGNTTGGFLNNLGGIFVVALLGFLFWPVIVPLYGTGENWRIGPLNWILEVLWLVVVCITAVTIRRHRNGYHWAIIEDNAVSSRYRTKREAWQDLAAEGYPPGSTVQYSRNPGTL